MKIGLVLGTSLKYFIPLSTALKLRHVTLFVLRCVLLAFTDFPIPVVSHAS